MKRRNEKKEFKSVIGSCVLIDQAIVKSNEDLFIDGEFSGEICCSGEVFIGEEGIIKGKITSMNISIAGSFSGTLSAFNNVCILGSGVVDGEITAKNIVADEGAVLNCICSTTSNNEDASTKINEISTKFVGAKYSSEEEGRYDDV